MPRNFRFNEIATIGLPMRITVLSIVGLVGFYAILSALNSAPTPPESMFAISNISTFSIPPQGLGEKEVHFDVIIKVIDGNSRGIEKANVIIRSPDRKNAYSGVTASGGYVIIKISNPQLPAGKAEGYLSVKVMREGFRDFTGDYFIKIIKG